MDSCYDFIDWNNDPEVFGEIERKIYSDYESFEMPSENGNNEGEMTRIYSVLLYNIHQFSREFIEQEMSEYMGDVTHVHIYEPQNEEFHYSRPREIAVIYFSQLHDYIKDEYNGLYCGAYQEICFNTKHHFENLHSVEWKVTRNYFY